MTVGDRITDRMKARELSQAELARRVGISQAAIWKLLNGGQGSTHIHRIARELGTTPAYLTGETDDPSEGSLPMPTAEQLAEQLGVALIPELELGYSMGGGSVFTEYEQKGVVPFQREWLRPKMKGSFAELFVARGEGDSMQPTMLDGDIVVIDTAQKDVRQQDRIWALSYGDLGMIKRVRKLPGDGEGSGGYDILSDNHEAVAPFRAYDGEMHIVGRVIWIGRWV